MLATPRIEYGCWFHCIDLPPTSEIVAFSQQALVDQRQVQGDIDIPNECRYDENALYRHHHWRGCTTQHTHCDYIVCRGGQMKKEI